MAYETYGNFSMDCADSDTMKAYRLVYVDSSGDVDLPAAGTDAEVLAIIGTTVDAPTEAGDVTVRPIGGGVAKVAVAASQTVADGNDLYLNTAADDGTVITGTSGWLVGTCVSPATVTSGASELAVVSCV